MPFLLSNCQLFSQIKNLCACAGINVLYGFIESMEILIRDHLWYLPTSLLLCYEFCTLAKKVIKENRIFCTYFILHLMYIMNFNIWNISHKTLLNRSLLWNILWHVQEIQVSHHHRMSPWKTKQRKIINIKYLIWKRKKTKMQAAELCNF